MEVVLVGIGLVDGGLGLESARGDVAFKQFLVDQVDDGRDELLQVFGPFGKRLDIGWRGESACSLTDVWNSYQH